MHAIDYAIYEISIQINKINMYWDNRLDSKLERNYHVPLTVAPLFESNERILSLAFVFQQKSIANGQKNFVGNHMLFVLMANQKKSIIWINP